MENINKPIPKWKEYLNKRINRSKELLRIYKYSNNLSEIIIKNINEMEIRNLIEARNRKRYLIANPDNKLCKFERNKVYIYRNEIIINYINYEEKRCEKCYKALKNNKHKCFKCICNKVFNKKKLFNRHTCTYKKNMFECEFCKKIFSRGDALTRHEKTHFNKKIKCNLCEYKTSRSDHLKKHVKNKHKVIIYFLFLGYG